jgi:predicted hydrocarbon binding protein
MYNPSAFAMEKHAEKTTHSGKQNNFFPNRMGLVVQLAMEEILGQSGGNAMHDLLDLPAYSGKYSPNDDNRQSPILHISQLQDGLESAYGNRTGRGLAQRVGRACLKYALREFGPELGLTDLAFRLLPLQTKLKTCTEAFASLFNSYTDQKVRLERDEKYLYWLIERCPQRSGGVAESPSCHLAMGFLQEALFWISGGKYFDVEEKQCISCGDFACTIRIDRNPMV